MTNENQVTVHCEAHMGARHNYPDALTWKVDDFGNLRVIGAGDKGLAAYPQGRWLWVSRTATKESA